MTGISTVKVSGRENVAGFFDLVGMPDNPVPPGGEVVRLVTPDGVVLRTALWPTGAERSRGTVIILQGRAEFIEKYFEVVGELRARGFDVVAFDWRGQGGSDRSLVDRYRGHVRRFADFRTDYEAVVRHLEDRGLASPVYVMAHSMGGCVALTGASEGWLAPDRLVLSSPMIGLSIVKRQGFTRMVARILAGIGLGDRMVPGGYVRSISTLPFEGNRLSTDRGRYARNAAVAAALDWGAVGSPTIGWVRAAYEAMDRLARPEAAASIAVPTLVIASDRDPICSSEAIELFARGLTAGTLVTVPGARHEVLMETDAMRAVFWEAFDAFVADPGMTAPPADLDVEALTG